MAINYNLIGDYTEAENILTKLINSTEESKSGTLAKVYHNLGYVKEQQRLYDEAILFLQKSIDLKSEPLEILHSLFLKARIVYAKKEDRLALKIVEEGFK